MTKKCQKYFFNIEKKLRNHFFSQKINFNKFSWKICIIIISTKYIDDAQQKVHDIYF